MSIKKYASVHNIFDELITLYNLDGYPGLAVYLDVKYQTLMAWKKRGRIGDFAPFLDKCKGISLRTLETLEGELFETDKPLVIAGGLSPEKQYLLAVIEEIKKNLSGMTDEKAEEAARVLRKLDRELQQS